MYSQRDQRTNLFGDGSTRRTNLFVNLNNSKGSVSDYRTPSPYEKDDKKSQAYNQSLMSTLESQNDDAMSGIQGKVKLLKDLGVRMGSEIRGSNQAMDSLNETFSGASTKVKLTYNRMMIMSKNAGIGWRVWFLFFFAVFLFFFWVWIH